jgi:hypothetical protein
MKSLPVFFTGLAEEDIDQISLTEVNLTSSPERREVLICNTRG